MIERKQDRRRSASSHFTSPINDRRRPKFERRGTAAETPAPVREVRLYGERRRLPDAGME
jgi:hypothetical protein